MLHIEKQDSLKAYSVLLYFEILSIMALKLMLVNFIYSFHNLASNYLKIL